MSLYEGMFVMDNRQANRDWEGSLEKLKAMLVKHKAELVRCEKWGERKLAYEMTGRRRGTYVLLYFNATGLAVNQIYRECELSDMMLRTLILKIEKMPSEEQMRNPEEVGNISRGRPDRGDRPDRSDRPDRFVRAPEAEKPEPAPAPAAAPRAPSEEK